MGPVHRLLHINLEGIGAGENNPAGLGQSRGDVPEPGTGETVVDILYKIQETGVIEGVVPVDDYRAFNHLVPLMGDRVGIVEEVIGIVRILVRIDDGLDHVKSDIVR